MIGILGGTFDPIHYGHLRCAVEAKEIFGLDHVRLIPSAKPPHRKLPNVSPLMRAQMVELAIINHTGLVCDRRELERHLLMPTSQSFMVDTLASLRSDFPNQPLLLFIGNDAFNQLPRWHCWQQLFDYAHIVVMTRPGFNMPVLNDFFQTRFTLDIGCLGECLTGKLAFQAVTALDISATAIRAGIAKQQDQSFLLPDGVIKYINQHHLYQSPR